MNWEEIAMSALWGLVGSLVGVIGTLGASIWSDRKGYNKISNKVGELNNTTLSGQHNEISNLIKNIDDNVKNTITNKAKFIYRYTRELYSKVEQITKTMDKNEGRYENLNLDQREIKNNLDKLILEWQDLIKENKELKKEIESLKNQNNILLLQNDKLINKERSVKKNRGYER